LHVLGNARHRFHLADVTIPSLVNRREIMSVLWEDPLPQVGAVLHFDSSLPDELSKPITKGSKYWMLDGSCVLVSLTHALGVLHTLSKPGTKGVFLPGEGIFTFAEVDDEASGHRKGDYLGLIPLGAPVHHTSFLPWKRIKKDWGKYARVAGYGRWQSGEERKLDGIQRRARIDLARWHRDNLDLEWSVRDNNDLTADRNNSGGPLLWGHGPSDFEVIGISREREILERGIVQMASWIGDDRNEWLGNVLGAPTPSAESFAPRWELLWIHARRRRNNDPSGDWVRVSVPAGAKTARATLSATPGLRLQMGLTQTEDPEKLLARLADCDTASGRFLVRPIEEDDFQLDGSDTLTIAVAPVAVAPEKATEVEAQVCVRFA
jgi:hypothetical protein